jgi:lysophospholipase L1-like esterase
MNVGGQAIQLPYEGKPYDMLNNGTNTVYYGDANVSLFSHVGGVAPGASVTLNIQYYVICPAGSSDVEFTDIPMNTSPPISLSQLPLSVVSNSSVKRVTAAIGAEGTFTLTDPFDVNQRQLIELPVTTSQWRLRIRNYEVLLATANAGTLNLTGVYVGPPIYTGGPYSGLAPVDATFFRPTCCFDGTQQQALGAASLPNDGSEWTSAWVTGAGLQFSEGIPTVLAVGLNSGGTTITVAYDSRGCSAFSIGGGTAVSASVGAQSLLAGGGSFVYSQWLDVRLEYEFVTANQDRPRKVILAIGDSITGGYISDATHVIATGIAGFPHEAWPAAAASKSRSAIVNLGVSSSKAHDWAASSTSDLWTRADLATTVPDEAWVALGTNDISNGASAATTLGYLGTIIGYVRALGIQKIRLGTLAPMNWTPSNALEIQRQALNAAIRQMPFGVAGIIDGDKAAYALQSTPSYADSDIAPMPPHPSLAGHQRIAAVAA